MQLRRNPRKFPPGLPAAAATVSAATVSAATATAAAPADDPAAIPAAAGASHFRPEVRAEMPQARLELGLFWVYSGSIGVFCCQSSEFCIVRRLSVAHSLLLVVRHVARLFACMLACAQLVCLGANSRLCTGNRCSSSKYSNNATRYSTLDRTRPYLLCMYLGIHECSCLP